MRRNRRPQEQRGEQGLIKWLSNPYNQANYKYRVIMTSKNREVTEAIVEMLGFNTKIINIYKVREEMSPIRLIDFEELIIE